MTEWTLSSFHKANYRPEQCAEMVTAEGGWHHVQCSRKRGYGPEQAYCKQHSPESVQARRAKWEAKYEAEKEEWRTKGVIASAQNAALIACREIAAGHNDPRARAQKVLDMLEGIDP